MQQTETTLPEIHLVGITARTNLMNEMNPLTAKIGLTAQDYLHKNYAEKIQNRKKPGTTYSVYTDYASDYRGDYTYFIGEEVTELKELPEGMTAITIPAQHYLKYTTFPGPMPQVCINAWQHIWLTQQEENAERLYEADFEIYDERAADPFLTVLDIYVGVKK